ncbi:hypothetical protein ABEB36_010611 [Hypothenemus hampei]|uniref:Uncharacterized protein n=1 Tax=Hypothenemus hampei TaxID=57062 RepID=A0ABD1ECH7_HYPHA
MQISSVLHLIQIEILGNPNNQSGSSDESDLDEPAQFQYSGSESEYLPSESDIVPSESISNKSRKRLRNEAN